MNLGHNRSQFVKTSQKSRYKGRNSLFPVYVNNIEEAKNELERNLKARMQKQNSQKVGSFREKEEVKQKIQLSRLSTTIASSFNQNNLPSHRAISSNQKFRSTSQPSIFNFKSNNSTPRPSTQLKNHNNFQLKQRFSCIPFEAIKIKSTQDRMSSQNNVNMIIGQILQRLKKQQNLQEGAQIISALSQSQSKNVRLNFLKKRTSLERSLLHNIFQSKLRSKLVYSSQNYSNHIPNTLFHQKIKQKIPNEFRDFIGPQQMLRMTRILSGVRLKTTDMNNKIQTTMRNRQSKGKLKTSTSQGNDDLYTLKSIKRW